MKVKAWKVNSDGTSDKFLLFFVLLFFYIV